MGSGADGADGADGAGSPEIDTGVPHSARIWNYWLGGKDNYAADRAAGDQFRENFPAIVDNARAFRHFLARSIRYLAGEAGISQFLDIGTGLPTVDNTHEVAQRVAPHARIVYVDNDPLVFAHARALLTSSPEGVTDYLHADLRDTGAILQRAADILDFEQPIALILSGILGHFSDDDEVRAIVARLTEALPPGSYLVICDGTDTDDVLREAQRDHNDSGAVHYELRSPARIAALFAGLELVEPGVVTCPAWRPEHSPWDPKPVDAYGGVGRKP